MDARDHRCVSMSTSTKAELNSRVFVDVDFDPLLVICIEGFQETEHPFVFLARQSYRELLALDCAREKTLPILTKVVTALRRALMTTNDDIFLMAVEGIR